MAEHAKPGQATSPPDETLGLGDDFAANRPEATAKLAGRRYQVLSGSETIEYVFDDATHLRWRVVPGDGSGGGAFTAETYEALNPAPDLYLVTLQHAAAPATSLELVLDTGAGRTLAVHQEVGPKSPGVPAVLQRVGQGWIVGHPAPGPIIRESDELAGVRAMWEYSANDIYEHIYLNSQWYVWHCLAGEEYPLADTDPCTVYKLRSKIYALVFTEKVMTMGAVMVLDYAHMRSYCAALGDSSGGGDAGHFVFGAHGTVLSRTVYPNPLSAADAAATTPSTGASS
jgi:hypothetical protein